MGNSPDEIAAYCAFEPGLNDLVERGYVGSERHVDNLDAQVDIAPADLRADLVVLRDWIEEKVHPSLPRSQNIELWPEEVRAAADEATAYVDEHC